MGDYTAPILRMGDLTRVIGIAARTASKMIDAGAIDGWRIPLSGDISRPGDRRTTPAAVISMCRRLNMTEPLRRALRRWGRWLVVVNSAMPDLPALGDPWVIRHATDDISAGAAIGEAGSQLEAVYADGQSRADLSRLAEFARSHNPDVRLVVVRPGERSCELVADGWRVLATDATAAQVAAAITGEIPHG